MYSQNVEFNPVKQNKNGNGSSKTQMEHTQDRLQYKDKGIRQVNRQVNKQANKSSNMTVPDTVDYVQDNFEREIPKEKFISVASQQNLDSNLGPHSSICNELQGNGMGYEFLTEEGRISTNNSRVETDTKISLFSGT